MQNINAKFSVIAILAFVLLFRGFAFGVSSDQQKGTEKKDAKKSVASRKMSLKDAPAVMTVLCTDGSNLKMTVLDEYVRLNTRFGVLVIPLDEIHRIEIATRILEHDSKIIDESIRELGSSDFKERRMATGALYRFGRRAYPALLKAAGHPDSEVAVRSKKLIKDLEDEISAELLSVRDRDVIYTEDSKISGWIEVEALNVETTQFGKQKLKLSDIRNVQSPNAVEPEPKNVLPDPGRLTSFRGYIGKTYFFRVTGSIQGGTLWGTGEYTLDSNLAMAVVHAGILKPGKTGIVKVKILGGSTRLSWFDSFRDHEQELRTISWGVCHFEATLSSLTIWSRRSGSDSNAITIVITPKGQCRRNRSPF